MMKDNMESIHAVATAATNRAQPNNNFSDFGNQVATMLGKFPPSKTIPAMTSILNFLGEQMTSDEMRRVIPATAL